MLCICRTMSLSDVEFCQWAFDGSVLKLKSGLSADANLVHKTDQDGRTALHWAASSGQLDAVSVLTSNNAKVCIKLCQMVCLFKLSEIFQMKQKNKFYKKTI